MRGVVWLRRDLRLNDNVALQRACARCDEVVLCFVLDPAILHSERVGSPIVHSFLGALAALREELNAMGTDVALLEGDPANVLPAFVRRVRGDALFYNEDYEPSAIERDRAVTEAMRAAGIDVHAWLDHVYFGAGEVERADGEPYRVYTPYRKRWLEHFRLANRLPAASAQAFRTKALPAAAIGATRACPAPEALGYASAPGYPAVSESVGRRLLAQFVIAGGGIERYREERNFPARDATSRLSPHLRAGTLGIRECVERAFMALENARGAAGANVQTWIDELIWRDYYQMILQRFPHVTSRAFLPNGDRVAWRESDADFSAWCRGQTGIPIVDAAMVQLNTTGWMHNRLRMIVASFLTKHLLIDWRRGERYFEQHLADADLAQNNGGWQWAASTGTDAAPYFRIFNPVRQGENFDPSGLFVRSMLPALRDVPDACVHAPWKMASPPRDYPAPIVQLDVGRARALEAFAAAFARTT